MFDTYSVVLDTEKTQIKPLSEMIRTDSNAENAVGKTISDQFNELQKQNESLKRL